jgi:hypothetical protein
MNIEHVGFLSWFPERRDARKHKNHAQDCETLSATMSRSERPAILPWLSSLKWRPSFRWYGRFTRYRPAAGLLLDTPRGHFMPTRKTRATCARELC